MEETVGDFRAALSSLKIGVNFSVKRRVKS